MVSWLQVTIVYFILMGIFATVSALRTWLGITVSAALFALVLALVMIALKFIVDYQKEGFHFEVSDNIPQCKTGFSGRPIDFEYTLPDCDQCANN